ncbi:hypothetical protein [Erwinia sp. JH02]|uniref:hypothetical protein n=1 Tax=Erwinia sp. JH02 TaxID=2733394 RepID=UPI0014895BAD|nr:hypothetical protein [Erwinia sp. JH02]NNS06417.1 hypothetical protein [Erwinia sp. JH02]
MKRTMIALTALAVLSSFNTSAEDQSHAFNDAVSTLHQLQDQEKDNLAHYNETDSNDGTGRFNADGSFNDSLAMQGDKIRADRRAAQRQVNGTTYRNQVQQQQTDAKAADLANTVAQSKERVNHDDRLLGAMARQPMATLTPSLAAIGPNQRKNSDMAVALADARQADADRRAKEATAYNRNATADKLGQQMQQQKMVDHARIARDAAIANFDAQQAVRDQQAIKMSGMARQPMATLSPAVNIGVKTPVQSMPSVILNKPVSVSKITFATGKGNAGGQGGHASHGGSGNRGGDNAHSAAFGGHGYGHDNSRSEGFGGHSHFH